MSIEILGLIATTVIIGSLFLKRRVHYAQIAGSCLWLTYGLLTNALPIVICSALALVIILSNSFAKKKVVTA